MSKTFTLFRTIAAPVGQSTHDIYKIPTGRSAIIDITITWRGYTPDSSDNTNPSMGITIITKKRAGGAASIGTDYFSSPNSFSLKKCILESDDTISISVNGLKASSFDIFVIISGIIQ